MGDLARAYETWNRLATTAAQEGVYSAFGCDGPSIWLLSEHESSDAGMGAALDTADAAVRNGTFAAVVVYGDQEVYET